MCQVLFVSNHPPEYFENIRKDEAILNKLIVIELKAVDHYSHKERIVNFKAQMDQYALTMFHWAMHVPLEELSWHVRADMHRDLILKYGWVPNVTAGLVSFVMDKFVATNNADPNKRFGSKEETVDDFIVASDLFIILEQYYYETGDPEID